MKPFAVVIGMIIGSVIFVGGVRLGVEFTGGNQSRYIDELEREAKEKDATIAGLEKDVKHHKEELPSRVADEVVKRLGRRGSGAVGSAP